EVDPEVHAKLLLKGGRQVGDKPIDDSFVKGHSKFKSIWDLSQAITKGEATLADVRELRPVLRLPPPRRGFRGIKRGFHDGGDLADRIGELEADGHAEKDDSRINVDLTAAGSDKLLGSGRVTMAMRITVAKASPAAVAKVSGAGGEVVLPGDAGK